jgi:hypothetical protein
LPETRPINGSRKGSGVAPHTTPVLLNRLLPLPLPLLPALAPAPAPPLPDEDKERFRWNKENSVSPTYKQSARKGATVSANAISS